MDNDSPINRIIWPHYTSIRIIGLVVKTITPPEPGFTGQPMLAPPGQQTTQDKTRTRFLVQFTNQQTQPTHQAATELIYAAYDEDGNLISTTKVPAQGISTFTPLSEDFWATGHQDGSVQVWQHNQQVAVLQHGAPVNYLKELSPGCLKSYSNPDQTLKIWRFAERS